jgi:hypothetical protein
MNAIAFMTFYQPNLRFMSTTHGAEPGKSWYPRPDSAPGGSSALFHEMAGHEMVGPYLKKLRRLLPADLLTQAAAGVEAAARRGIDGTLDVSLKDYAFAGPVGLGIRYGNG